MAMKRRHFGDGETRRVLLRNDKNEMFTGRDRILLSFWVENIFIYVHISIYYIDIINDLKLRVELSRPFVRNWTRTRDLGDLGGRRRWTPEAKQQSVTWILTFFLLVEHLLVCSQLKPIRLTSVSKRDICFFSIIRNRLSSGMSLYTTRPRLEGGFRTSGPSHVLPLVRYRRGTTHGIASIRPRPTIRFAYCLHFPFWRTGSLSA